MKKETIYIISSSVGLSSYFDVARDYHQTLSNAYFEGFIAFALVFALLAFTRYLYPHHE